MAGRCPKCAGGLTGSDLDGIPIESCGGCGGFWIAREFAEIRLQQHRASGKAPALDLESRRLSPTGLVCPDCDIRLDRYSVRGTAIERCPRCDGLFFEAGELERLAGASSSTTPATGAAAPARPLAETPASPRATRPLPATGTTSETAPTTSRATQPAPATSSLHSPPPSKGEECCALAAAGLVLDLFTELWD